MSARKKKGRGAEGVPSRPTDAPHEGAPEEAVMGGEEAPIDEVPGEAAGAPEGAPTDGALAARGEVAAEIPTEDALEGDVGARGEVAAEIPTEDALEGDVGARGEAGMESPSGGDEAPDESYEAAAPARRRAARRSVAAAKAAKSDGSPGEREGAGGSADESGAPAAGGSADESGIAATGGSADESGAPATGGSADESGAPATGGSADEAGAPAAGDAEGAAAGELDDDIMSAEGLSDERLVSLVESLLFAADRPLTMADFKRLLGTDDQRRLEAAIETLTDRRFTSGVQVITAGGGWRLRTHPDNGLWVARLLGGKPVRLSRAMLETLAIVAYRQPITRPEVDEIRGVDCGPVLKTLLDRNLVRVLGKKEDVGRPLLYGTTSEFLRVFNLRDLTELPTLREFHELTAEHQAKLEAKHGRGEAPPLDAPVVPSSEPVAPHPGIAGPDPDEDETLLEELDRAADAAARAAGQAEADGGKPAPPQTT